MKLPVAVTATAWYLSKASTRTRDVGFSFAAQFDNAVLKLVSRRTTNWCC